MRKVTLIAISLALLTTVAEASPRRLAVDANGVALISNPDGCPSRLFCGCGLARYWGIWERPLNKVSEWVRKFPRAHGPAVGVAAVRRDQHHILGIVGGGPGAWEVVDFNSGNHQSRRYVASDFPGYFFLNVRSGFSAL